MAYTVLARKYRSRTFAEVIGQGPIATTLVNAIHAGRIHHGYLFTGTRGVGKTSMARILAKALNCLAAQAPTPDPCCQCDACTAIAEGQDIDVVEIDAASNTGVDNIRELRSNTAYRPARARFKVYIIDEVHMLSTGAFNALLKTLEEPPPHVKFILATTEIQKVPATIQSRCQRFNFRNIGPEDVAQRLAAICKAEGAKADPAVLARVARLANGSMRDALSILDQLLSVSPSELTPTLLDEILPPAQNERVVGLLERAAEGDAGGVLETVDSILGTGRGIEVFCQDLLDVVRTLMLMRACGPQVDFVDVPAAGRERYAGLAQRFELSHYVQMVGLIEELRRNVRFSSAGRALADAAMVRLAHLRAWGSIEQVLEGLGGPVAPRSADARFVAPPRGEPGPDQKKKPADARAAMSPATVSATRAASDRPDRPRTVGGFVAAPSQVGQACPSPGAPVENVRRGPLPVSEAEQERIRADPLVAQALDLFQGLLVNIEKEDPRPSAEAAEAE